MFVRVNELSVIKIAITAYKKQNTIMTTKQNKETNEKKDGYEEKTTKLTKIS